MSRGLPKAVVSATPSITAYLDCLDLIGSTKTVATGWDLAKSILGFLGGALLSPARETYGYHPSELSFWPMLFSARAGQ